MAVGGEGEGREGGREGREGGSDTATQLEQGTHTVEFPCQHAQYTANRWAGLDSGSVLEYTHRELHRDGGGQC